MQLVSDEYRKSMSSPLRERAYIKILFGLINSDAQTNAKIKQGNFTSYSDLSRIFQNSSVKSEYASFDRNFIRLDGSFVFAPEYPDPIHCYIKTIVSEDFITDYSPFEMKIEISNGEPIDFKGMTINFGSNYPVDFDIIDENNQKIEIRGNNTSIWKTEKAIFQTRTLKFIFTKMKKPQTRLRIYSILFGYGLIYYNDSVINSSLVSRISPIGAELPQIDFSVTLKNYDRYFDIDNPNSAINFLETGQKMTVVYGYELPETHEIEWLKGWTLGCSDWESDNKTATIRCVDNLRNLETEYIPDAQLTSFHDIAGDIFEKANINGFPDTQLMEMFTNNPLPIVSYKESLQLVANACRGRLYQARNGSIVLGTYYDPKFFAKSDDVALFTNIESVLDSKSKTKYAMFMKNYIDISGKATHFPKMNKKQSAGYVSNSLSGDNCLFEKPPMLQINLDHITTLGVFSIEFGEVLPSEIKISYRNRRTETGEFTIKESDIKRKTYLKRPLEAVEQIDINFIGTQKPRQRIIVNNIRAGRNYLYGITKMDMKEFPKLFKQELVKEIVVPYYIHVLSNSETNILTETVNVEQGQILNYKLSTHIKKPRIVGSSNFSIIKWSAYSITVKSNTSGKFELNISAYKYSIIEKQVTKELNSSGKTIKWENPLIDCYDAAMNLADWLADYYKSHVEYQYATRGNPEFDVLDIIEQENDFRENNEVYICETRLDFNGAFSGNLTTRRKEV